MKEYLRTNQKFWSRGYEAKNVESWVFRTYGRILVYEFKFDGTEKMLDFGCGQGATCNFFKRNGFDAYGVDVSEKDIAVAQANMPNHFKVISPIPQENQVFFGGEFQLITGIQSFYYLSNTDLDTLLRCLYKQMTDGGIFYATMMGVQSSFFEDSKPYKDGLRLIDTKSKRKKKKGKGVSYVNFTESEEELIKKFHMFKPVHIGFYDFKIRSDEGTSFHYNFVGQKE